LIGADVVQFINNFKDTAYSYT